MGYEDNEVLWRLQLQNCSLVIQVEYDDEAARAALKNIGYLLQREKYEYVERFFPASLLIGLNYVASAESEPGKLWPQIMHHLNDFQNTQPHQTRVSQLHRKALAALGLQRFEHPLGNLGEIQIHAGIPIKSQEAFIQKLTKAYKTEPDFDALVFNEMVRAIPRASLQAKGLDAPTWHFINQAGSVADDFVAKCIDVLDDMQDGVYDENGGLGLPNRVIKEIVRVVDEAGAIQRAKGIRRVAKPTVAWSDLTSQIEIDLPVMPEHQKSPTFWVLQMSDKTSELSVGQTLPGLAPQRMAFPIRAVTAGINLTASVIESNSEPLTRNWHLSLYSEDAPVLIFDREGNLDQLKGPLEPSTYKILLPEKYLGQVSSVKIDGELAAERIDAPFGWGDDALGAAWIAFVVDLSRAVKFEVFLGSDDKAKVLRSVSVTKRPRILPEKLVQGVFAEDGSPIHFELPNVVVPLDLREAEPWLIELKNEANSTLYVGEFEANNGLLSPGNPIELDGRVEMIVSRGFGATHRKKIDVISGLRSDLSSELRPLAQDQSGLQPTDVTLTKRAVSKRFKLSSKETALVIVDQDFSKFALSIRPPAEKFELLNTNSLKSSEWIEPTKSHIEDLPDLQLFATMSFSAGAELVGMWPGETLVALKPKESTPRIRFNLGEFAETANLKGAFELILKTGDGRLLKAGNCFPRKMLSGFEFQSDSKTLSLKFPGIEVPAGLEVCFYASRAPWLEPVVSPITTSEIELPPQMRDMGDLFFSIALSDPWTAKNFPDIPVRDGTNTEKLKLAAANPHTSPDHALAYWLETGNQTENLWQISVERAWQCMLLGQMQSGAIVNRVTMREFASRILQKNSREALAAYPINLRSDEHYLKHLTIAGLVAEPAIPGIPSAQVARHPFLACLLTDETEPSSVQELLDTATSAWGLRGVQESLDDQHSEGFVETLLRKAGLFKAQPMLFSAFGDEELQAFTERFVPGSLFEGGSMAQIVFELGFSADKVSDVIDQTVLDQAFNDLKAITKELGEAYDHMARERPFAPKELRENVRKSRGARILTLDIPSLSIRLAMLARLSARGNVMAAKLWTRNKFALQQISTAFPKLVELDLTTSELFLKLQERQTHGQH